METDYNSILGAVRTQATQEQEQAKQLQQIFYAMGQNQAEIASAKEQGTTAVAIDGKTRSETLLSAKQRMQAELRAQNQTRALADTFDYKALYFSIAEETRGAISKQRELANKIEQDASVSLFDDPLRAIANAYTLPWEQQALAATNSRINLLTNAQEQVATQINRYSETSNKIKESLTQASIDSISAGLASDQRAIALEAHNKALYTDAQGIEAVSRMNHQQLQTLNSGYKIIETEENRQWVREQKRMALEEREANRANKEKHKLLILEDVGFVKDSMIKTYGKLNFSDDEIQRALERKDPLMSDLRDKGVVRRLQGIVADGASPQERNNFWLHSGKQITTEGQRALRDLNTASILAEEVKKLKGPAAEAASQDIVKKKLGEWQSDVGSGDKSNPLGLPAFKSMGDASAVRNNPAFAIIKDTVESDKHKDLPVDMQLVYGQLIEGIAAKKVRPEDAVRLLHDFGIVYRTWTDKTNKVYEMTNEFQTEATVTLRPGTKISNLLMDRAPLLAAAGAPVGLAGVAAVVGSKYLADRSRLKMNLLDETSIRTAVAAGLAAKLVDIKLGAQ